jgi:cell wall-associated NlpC family hydrolase
MSSSSLLAWGLAALGGSALLAAYKDQTWLSTIEHALDGATYTPTKLPGAAALVGTDSAAPGVGRGDLSPADPHSIAVDFAEQQLGKPYLYGASGPNRWDCSGLTQVAFRKAGYTMVHNAAAQYAQTRKYRIAKTTSPPFGTLVFFGIVPGAVTHVGIGLGDGAMIEAPHTGDVVKYYSVATEAAGMVLIGVTDPLSSIAQAKTPSGAVLE